MTAGGGTLPTNYSDGNIWSAGSVTLVTTDVNANSSGLLYPLVASDTSLGSVSIAASGTSAWTEIGVADVGAGVVDNHVKVQVVLKTTTTQAQMGTEYDILIGESGSEVSKETDFHFRSLAGTTTSTICFYYEPDAGEKTNGFQVQVNGRLTKWDAGGTAVTLFCKYVYVYGN